MTYHIICALAGLSLLGHACVGCDRFRDSNKLAMAYLLEAKCDAALAAETARADSQSSPDGLHRVNAGYAMQEIGADPESMVPKCRRALGLEVK